MEVNVCELVTGILEYLGSSALQEISWIFGVTDELEMIKSTLFAIDAVLLDVQSQQSTSMSMRIWLDSLKRVAYDIEDVLDLISTQELELKANGRTLFRRITKLFTDYDVARELKAIRRRLDEIEYNRRNFVLQEMSSTLHLPIETVGKVETYSHVQDSGVFGREEDKEKIVSCLMSSSGNDIDCLAVIPIVGIGGMGKTTLAKLLYNDPRVALGFELRLWVHVSNKFVLRTLVLGILQAATGLNFSGLNMESLQKKLHEKLGGRTYLLILDDVWIKDPKEWMQLKELLAIGSSRSRVIVTTREERVASVTGTVEAYSLQGLSDDDCWSIFAKCAFNKGEEEMYPLLVRIGKSIVQKCLGVPLAAKTLGSMLRNETDVHVWKQIQESELWKIVQGSNDILPALKLSYDHTPYHLRSCFALCAVFEKGCPLFKPLLITMWMALKLGQLGGKDDSVEDMGNKYFNELLSRSFFQLPGYDVANQVLTKYAEMAGKKSSLKDTARLFKKGLTENRDLARSTLFQINGQTVFVEMHDLMHDLAMYVSKEESVVVTSYRQAISPYAKHIIWDCESLSIKQESFVHHFEASKARVFAFVHPMGSVSKSFLNDLMSNFKCLRILNLSNFEFEELPDAVGNLKHLRYLNLSWNSKLTALPRSICKLVNLQALDLCNCVQLKCLPKDIHKLLCLRNLRLTSTFTYMHQGMYELSSLRMLGLWACQRLTCLLEGIGCLNNLRVLQIFYCDSIKSLPNDIKYLTNLEELKIHFCESLDLKGWEGLHGMKSLRHLDFSGLPKLLELPEMHKSMGGLHMIVISKCEGLRAMPKGMQHCTSLLRLTLSTCPNVLALSTDMHALKYLQELIINGCPHLSQRCEKDVGSDWYLISHIRKICIDHRVVQNAFPPIHRG